MPIRVYRLYHVRGEALVMVLNYADDAGVVSQSPEQPRKMIGVTVVVCAALGLTVSEEKTEVTG